MTGNEMLTEFDGIAANDLDPLATTTAAKLILLNIAAKRIMIALRILTRSVPITYATGTTRYSLTTLSTPLGDVNRVRYNDVDYYRNDDEDGKGWALVDDYIDIFFDVVDTEIVYVDGFALNQPIVATAGAITDIPVDLHLAVVQLAIIEGCVAHEDDPNQLTRLQRIERTALDKINRRVSTNASKAFAFVGSRR